MKKPGGAKISALAGLVGLAGFLGSSGCASFGGARYDRYGNQVNTSGENALQDAGSALSLTNRFMGGHWGISAIGIGLKLVGKVAEEETVRRASNTQNGYQDNYIYQEDRSLRNLGSRKIVERDKYLYENRPRLEGAKAINTGAKLDLYLWLDLNKDGDIQMESDGFTTRELFPLKNGELRHGEKAFFIFDYTGMREEPEFVYYEIRKSGSPVVTSRSGGKIPEGLDRMMIVSLDPNEMSSGKYYLRGSVNNKMIREIEVEVRK